MTKEMLEKIRKHGRLHDYHAALKTYAGSEIIKQKPMNTELQKLITSVFETYVKPMNKNSDGEQSCCEWDDARSMVEYILSSNFSKWLLRLFWQRSSDACPLECGISEK